jgi:RNA polymerase primary sigma factor
MRHVPSRSVWTIIEPHWSEVRDRDVEWFNLPLQTQAYADERENGDSLLIDLELEAADHRSRIPAGKEASSVPEPIRRRKSQMGSDCLELTSAHFILRAQAGDQRAADRLIEMNIGLIDKEVTRRLSCHPELDRDDLFQEGRIGIWVALQKFDLKRTYRDRQGRVQHYKFSTVATDWVRQRIGRYIENYVQTIRFPVYQMVRLAKLRAAQERLDQKLNRDPSVVELAVESGLTVDQVKELLELPVISCSLDAPTSFEGESGYLTMSEIIPDESSVTYQKHLTDRGWLQDLLDQLHPDERQLIECRVDWHDQGDSQPPELIGHRSKKKLGRESIRMKEARAVRKLRGYYRLKLEADRRSLGLVDNEECSVAESSQKENLFIQKEVPVARGRAVPTAARQGRRSAGN